MPVLYELGASIHGGAVAPQHTSVTAQPYGGLATQSKFHFPTSYDFLPDTLRWLCVVLAILALLSLLLQTRASSARQKQAPTQIPIEKSPPYPTEDGPFFFEPRFTPEYTRLFEEPESYFREREGSAASYYDLQDDLGMDQSQSPSSSSMSSSGSSKISEPATMQDPEKWAQQNWSRSPKQSLTQSQSSDIDATSGVDFANTGEVPRRRSYTKIKTVEGQGDEVVLNTMKIQEEIIVAEGWRRHTRVYGGGVCLACAESEKRMKSIGMSDPQAGFA